MWLYTKICNFTRIEPRNNPRTKSRRKSWSFCNFYSQVYGQEVYRQLGWHIIEAVEKNLRSDKYYKKVKKKCEVCLKEK